MRKYIIGAIVGISLWFASWNSCRAIVIEKLPSDTNWCLSCICESISNCSRTIGCHANFCGMFYITKPYWVDAGSPVVDDDDPNLDSSYRRCATTDSCAIATVSSYLKKFGRDCDRDGIIDCHDYLIIHVNGGNEGCNKRVHPVYWNNMLACESELRT